MSFMHHDLSQVAVLNSAADSLITLRIRSCLHKERSKTGNKVYICSCYITTLLWAKSGCSRTTDILLKGLTIPGNFLVFET